jgi:hypothetical protein
MAKATIDEIADEIASLAVHLDPATHHVLACIRAFDEAGAGNSKAP